MRVDIGQETTFVPRMPTTRVHSLQPLARAYLTGFNLALTRDEMSFDATAQVAHARLDASDILVETPPKAPPGTRRPRKPPRVIPSPPPPTPQCAGGCKEHSRRGTNATVERFTCVDCGFVTTRSKGATEDAAMHPHVETDTVGSSKPRNEATVRESTAKDVSRADTSQFRDISRAMHVRPQMTLNAISGTDLVGLFDAAIESILDTTETRNTGTTITTNDTSSGATSSLSASQLRTVIQSKAFVA